MRWLLVLLILILFESAVAIQISEIMYDLPGSDTGREWVEICNNNSVAENLTGWKFFEGGTNHGLTLTNGSWILDAGAYAIIADNPATFLQDNPSYAGTLFDSSFSLSNTGEQIGLKNSSLELVESITYNSSWGANGNGNSLQFVNGNWCEGNTTPGYANVCTVQEPQPKPQPVCGNGILEEGETSDTCCADAGCPQNESCISNQCKFVDNTTNNESQPQTNFSVSILELPTEVKQGENFTAEIELTNNFNETKTVDIYSYVYSGSILATEGGWTGNLQTLNLTAGKSTVVNLTNNVKPDAIVGTYSFKVRAVVDSKKYDKTSAIELLKNDNLTDTTAGISQTQEKPEQSKTSSNNSDYTIEVPAGASVWSSGSTTIGLAFWLFTAVLLIFVVLLLLMLLRKQNP
jgi:hypothetical protein